MVTRNLAYQPTHGVSGRLDVHLPDTPAGAPVVVVYHGGGLRALRKERMDNVAAFLAAAGFVTVNANYRLLTETEFPAPVEDALSVLRWLAAKDRTELAGADVSRVAVLGTSAGGYLALMVGLLEGAALLRGMVSVAGPSTRHSGMTYEQLWRLSDGRPVVPPVGLAHEGAPPLLALHNQADQVVPVNESRAIVQLLRASGVRAELHEYDVPARGHGIWREETEAPHLLQPLETKIARFLHEVLDDGD